MQDKERYFSSKQDDEDVILVIRKHWMELLPSLVMAGFIYLVSFGALILLPVLLPDTMTGLSYNFFIIILSLILLYNTGYLFSAWLIHYLNVGIITTEHVVEIVQQSLFSRKISELGLDRIQDVSASQHGLTATMFDFGVIDIQTAGELPNFLFENVPHPNETAQRIMELEEDYCKRHGLRRVNGTSIPNEQINQNIVQNLAQPEPVEESPNIEYPNREQ